MSRKTILPSPFPDAARSRTTAFAMSQLGPTTPASDSDAEGKTSSVSSFSSAGPEWPEGYKYVGPIGRGAQGTIREAVHPDGSMVAVKTIRKMVKLPAAVSDDDWIHSTPSASSESSPIDGCVHSAGLESRGTAASAPCAEVAVLRSVQHRFVVRLVDVVTTKHFIHLIMEKCVEPVLSMTKADPPRCMPLDRPVASAYLSQIMEGVQYMHSKRIIHGDLKPDNILISADGSIRIADFGCSVEVTEGVSTRSLNGSRLFMSPELHLMQDSRGTVHAAPIMRSTGTVDEELARGCDADVWAIGVIAWYMVFGSCPFPGVTKEEIVSSIQGCSVAYRDGCVDPKWMKFFRRIFVNSDNRVRLTELAAMLPLK